MVRYIAEIKHNLKQEKIYNFNSNVKVEAGDLVLVKRLNGKTSFATVLNCYNGKGEFTGEIVKVMHKDKNKLNELVGNLVYKGNVEILRSVYEDYKNKTMNNESVTFEQFKCKLARNIILADKPRPTDTKYIVRFEYGAMHIFVNLHSNEVIKITNRNKQPQGWRKNVRLYNKLNQEFEIEM